MLGNVVIMRRPAANIRMPEICPAMIVDYNPATRGAKVETIPHRYPFEVAFDPELHAPGTYCIKANIPLSSKKDMGIEATLEVRKEEIVEPDGSVRDVSTKKSATASSNPKRTESKPEGKELAKEGEQR